MPVKRFKPVLESNNQHYSAVMQENENGEYVKLDLLKDVLVEWSIVTNFTGSYIASPDELRRRMLIVALEACKNYVKDLIKGGA